MGGRHRRHGAQRRARGRAEEPSKVDLACTLFVLGCLFGQVWVLCNAAPGGWAELATWAPLCTLGACTVTAVLWACFRCDDPAPENPVTGEQ